MTLRDLIVNNFGWKLISLVLATLIWWRIDNLDKRGEDPTQTSAFSPAETQTFSLPVRVLGPARNLGGFTVVPSEVTVTLRGTRDVLERVKATNVVVYVDAAFPPDARSATLTVVVRPPAGVSVQEIRPVGVYVERM